ncbi:hypothetical protein HYV44_03885 [Candidatus Microgenomates bacterium]|nr:hypothetical protein [Candidatus Microgenomates bacterium]
MDTRRINIPDKWRGYAKSLGLMLLGAFVLVCVLWFYRNLHDRGARVAPSATEFSDVAKKSNELTDAANQARIFTNWVDGKEGRLVSSLCESKYSKSLVPGADGKVSDYCVAKCFALRDAIGLSPAQCVSIQLTTQDLNAGKGFYETTFPAAIAEVREDIQKHEESMTSQHRQQMEFVAGKLDLGFVDVKRHVTGDGGNTRRQMTEEHEDHAAKMTSQHEDHAAKMTSQHGDQNEKSQSQNEGIVDLIRRQMGKGNPPADTTSTSKEPGALGGKKSQGPAPSADSGKEPGAERSDGSGKKQSASELEQKPELELEKASVSGFSAEQFGLDLEKVLSRYTELVDGRTYWDNVCPLIDSAHPHLKDKNADGEYIFSSSQRDKIVVLSKRCHDIRKSGWKKFRSRAGDFLARDLACEFGAVKQHHGKKCSFDPMGVVEEVGEKYGTYFFIDRVVKELEPDRPRKQAPKQVTTPNQPETSWGEPGSPGNGLNNPDAGASTGGLEDDPTGIISTDSDSFGGTGWDNSNPVQSGQVGSTSGDTGNGTVSTDNGGGNPDDLAGINDVDSGSSDSDVWTPDEPVYNF